jgi:hypothetical protein
MPMPPPLLLLLLLPLLLLAPPAEGSFVLLEPETYKANFVEGWPGPYANGTNAGLVNESVWDWATSNLPLFESSDRDVTDAYYFRAKTYHAHMNPTLYVDQPVVVSEFGAAVHWGGPYGSINAAAGHHISEGRWIRDRVAMDSNIKFWLGSMASGNDQTTPHYANGTRGESGGTPYSEWVLTAVLKRSEVLGAFTLGKDRAGAEVAMAAVLDGMVEWWETRTLQTRLDCAMARANEDAGAETCYAAAPGKFDYPFCYISDDG